VTNFIHFTFFIFNALGALDPLSPTLNVVNFLYFILLPLAPGWSYYIMYLGRRTRHFDIQVDYYSFFSGAKLKHISGHTRHFVPESFSPEALSPLDPIPKRHFTRPSCDWTTLNFSLIFIFYASTPSLITSIFDILR